MALQDDLATQWVLVWDLYEARNRLDDAVNKIARRTGSGPLDRSTLRSLRFLVDQADLALARVLPRLEEVHDGEDLP